MKVQSIASDSGGSNFTAPITAYWGIGNGRRVVSLTSEPSTSHKFKAEAVISNISCRSQSNTTTGTSTIVLRINAANGNGTFTIGAAATGEFVDTTNTDSIAVNDLVNYSITGGTTGGLNLRNFCCVVDSVLSPYQGLTNYSLATGLTAYAGFSGAQPGATESALQFQTRSYAKWSGMGVYITVNASTTNLTAKSRINGADGNQSVTITALTTGYFEDTSNTDNVTYNQKINYSMTGATTGNATFFTFNSNMQYAPTYQWINENDGTTIANSLNRFFQWSGNSFTGTEGPNRTRLKSTTIIGNLNCQVSANSLNGSTTVVDRLTGVSGTMLVTVGSSSTGYFEDTSKASNTYTTNNQVGGLITTAGSSGSITFQSWGVTVHPLTQG